MTRMNACQNRFEQMGRVMGDERIETWCKTKNQHRKRKQNNNQQQKMNTTQQWQWNGKKTTINQSTILTYLCKNDSDSRSMCFVVVVVAAVVVVAVDETMCVICVDFALKTERRMNASSTSARVCIATACRQKRFLFTFVACTISTQNNAARTKSSAVNEMFEKEQMH